MKAVVLDASALMAFFEQRKGAGKVEDLILLGMRGQCELLISVVNFGEVYYSTWRSSGPARAKRLRAEVAQLPIEMLDLDLETTIRAAEIHTETRIPYADSFPVALGAMKQAAVVTSDTDFSRVRHLVEVIWIN